MLSLGIATTGIKISYRIKLTSCRGAHTNIRADHIATLLVGFSVTVEDLGGLRGLYPSCHISGYTLYIDHDITIQYTRVTHYFLALILFHTLSVIFALYKKAMLV